MYVTITRRFIGVCKGIGVLSPNLNKRYSSTGGTIIETDIYSGAGRKKNAIFLDIPAYEEYAKIVMPSFESISAPVQEAVEPEEMRDVQKIHFC